MPDERVLQFAISDTRAVLTFDRGHFLRLHKTFPKHSGIVVCSEDNNWPALAERINAAIRASELLAGQLLRINKPQQ